MMVPLAQCVGHVAGRAAATSGPMALDTSAADCGDLHV